LENRVRLLIVARLAPDMRKTCGLSDKMRNMQMPAFAIVVAGPV